MLFRFSIQPLAGVLMNLLVRLHPLLARLAPPPRWPPSRPSPPAQTKWDLPAAYPATNFHTENLQQFANDVDKATGGKLKITVHANASLFKAHEIKRAVQGGQAQIGEVLLVNFQNEWQLYGIDGLPVPRRQLRRVDEALQGVASRRSRRSSASRESCCSTRCRGRRRASTSRSRSTRPPTCKGVKWRAYSPATARIAELVGAQPVTVQAAELSQAMATGVVESYMSSGSTGYDTKTYEHIKYWYDTQAWLPKNAVLVNKAAFDALDKPTQAAVLKAGADAEARGWALSQQKNGEYIELLKKNGMTILPPLAAAQGRHEEGRRHDAEGVARQGRRRRPGDRRRVHEAVGAGRRCPRASRPRAARVGRALDRLYDASAALGAVAMVLLLVDGAALDRLAPGRLQRRRRIDAYAGYMMAGAGFLAMAHTLKRGEHIRVTLLLGAATAAPRRASRSGRSRRRRCWPRSSPATAASSPGSRTPSTTSRPATMRRRSGCPQLSMALGAVVFAIAFVDELVLEIRGRRRRPVERAARAGDAMSDCRDHGAPRRARSSLILASGVWIGLTLSASPGSACSCSARARPATRWRSTIWGSSLELDADRAAALHLDGRDPLSHPPQPRTCSRASRRGCSACPGGCCTPTSSAARSSARSRARARRPARRSAR